MFTCVSLSIYYRRCTLRGRHCGRLNNWWLISRLLCGLSFNFLIAKCLFWFACRITCWMSTVLHIAKCMFWFACRITCWMSTVLHIVKCMFWFACRITCWMSTVLHIAKCLFWFACRITCWTFTILRSVKCLLWLACICVCCRLTAVPMVKCGKYVLWLACGCDSYVLSWCALFSGTNCWEDTTSIRSSACNCCPVGYKCWQCAWLILFVGLRFACSTDRLSLVFVIDIVDESTVVAAV